LAYKNKKDLYKNQINRWRKRKDLAVEYKGGKCERCSIQGHSSIFDFHHKDPKEKDCNWTKLRLKAWSSITTELDKCSLLCSNCHRLTHYEMYNSIH